MWRAVAWRAELEREARGGDVGLVDLDQLYTGA
jgi:hypothetical protein